MNKKLKWIIIILVVIVVGIIILKMAGVIGKDEGIKVSTEKVEKRDIVETVNASGKVFPEVEVKMSPDISGEIVSLSVEEGDSVKKGQVLAQIYGDIYASQRDQAAAVVNQQQAQLANAEAGLAALQAQYDQAKQTYDMQKKLYDQKIISQNEFNNAEAAYKTAMANLNAGQKGIAGGRAGVASARAALERANKDISRATLEAPMDGIISQLNVKEGERVVGSSMMAGTDMMRIADMSKMEVQVDVGENDIPKVHIGDSATVEIDAFNNRKFTGVVTQIATSSATTAQAAAGADVTNYKVHIRIDASSYQDLVGGNTRKSFPFRPGMNASADIKTTTRTQVLSVPINAVTTRDKDELPKDSTQTASNTAVVSDAGGLQEVVFVIQKDGTVSPRKVTTGIQDINHIEILEGLQDGEEVVTGPYEVVSKTLKDKTKVKVVPREQLF